jgi:hypothetical protein
LTRRIVRYLTNCLFFSSSHSAWPAVPYAELVARGEDHVSPQLGTGKTRSIINSPPRLVLNGSTSSSRASQQSLATVDPNATPTTDSGARALEDQISAFQRKHMNSNTQTESPIIPLSPDPFGRFSSSEANGVPPSNVDNSHVPERKSSLAARIDLSNPYATEDIAPDSASEVSKPPSSRFSADSIVEERETLPKPKDRGTLMSVKSIRKLWRKTNKASTSTMPPPIAEVSSASSSRPPSALASELERDASRNGSPLPPLPSLQGSQSMGATPYSSTSQKPMKPGRRDSGLDPFYFDQDSKYPVRRSPSPQTVQYSRSNTPTTLPPLPMSSPPLPGSAAMQTPVEKKRTSRKSILRWKSSANPTSPDGQAQEDAPEGRRRRPSLGDVASGIMRGSISSVSEPSPSVPEIPAMYRASHHQSRPSVTSPIAGEDREQPVRQTSIRRKPVPSSTTSTDSQASTDPLRTPISSSLSHGHGILTSPRGSEEIGNALDNGSKAS